LKPRIPLPQSVTLYITDHCQFRCAHCFLTDEHTLNSTHISSRLWRNLIPALGREKVFMVVIAGGDPFRHPEFLDIVAEIRSHRMLPLLALNPVVYERSSLGRLRELGIGHVQIGVPESLLSIRADDPDPFEDVSRSLEAFSREGIEERCCM
jgi:MoaA/NifB/PqqE/SkfB family radical SAM enzyme